MNRAPSERALSKGMPDGRADGSAAAQRERSRGWAESLVRWLDDGFRVPVLGIRIGLDPIVGFLLPGAGDAVTGVGSVSLLLLALRERVPTVALLRMLLNIGIDTLIGALPFVGDAFDVFWRSNRRNLEIIERYRGDPRAKPSPWDYIIVALALVLSVASVLLPFVVLALLGVSLGALLGLEGR